MADIAGKAISALTASTSPGDNDYIPMLVNGVTVKVKKVDFLAAVNSAISLKQDKAKTIVEDWPGYMETGWVGGYGPNEIFVMGDGVTHNDPELNIVLTSFDVQTYEDGHKRYQRWISRNTALTVLEDTGWVEVGGTTAPA